MHMCLYNDRYTSNKTIFVEYHMHLCLYNDRYTSNKTIFVSFICTCVCTMKDIHQIKQFMYVSYAHVFVQWKIYIK